MEIDQRLIALLQEFQQHMVELNIPATYLAPDETRPLPSLIVQVPPDENGYDRSVLLAFIPDEGEFKEFDLLQLYMELPIYPSEEEIANQLLLINLKAVLGHAGVNQSQELYWRHMWPIPRGLPIVPSVLLE
ncbi:MAG: hypothetical protein AAFY76_16740, partial [Cyanobacteria bacterium J06649_11]